MKAKGAYLSLTKPGIVFGNLVTGAGGFALAHQFDLLRFLWMMIGLAFVVGAACAFNNVIDREHDRKMHRTRNRPLVKGVLDIKQATRFGSLMLVLGTLVLIVGCGGLSALMALLGFVAYVFIYTFSKYKTQYGTLIGSVSGAMPPLVGYAAASGHLDLGAFLLFAIVVCWQMPHFYAIAIYRSHEYAAAGIPVMPLVSGMLRTKIEMTLYCFGFGLAVLALWHAGYTGYVYLGVSSALSLGWLIACLQGFFTSRDGIWARKVFIFSLIVITATCATLFVRI